MTHTATYSPDDNKLRISPAYRLPAEEYERVKAAGFRWAPKQEQFICPRWTPEAADLCIELAGEIGDDDGSLIERAEVRAERFEEYSENRAEDAHRARSAVSAIADNIPLGQPILIGHHSERHARKDAERIENGMRKAIKMWDTSKYWTERAAAAIAHAKYKERTDVRARRIAGIEADMRKRQRSISEAQQHMAMWDLVDQADKWKTKADGGTFTREERARWVADRVSLGVVRQKDNAHSYWTAYDVLRPDGERYQACPACTVDQVLERARIYYPQCIAYWARWVEHYENRLAYERAMLAEAGGLVATNTAMMPGGQVRRQRDGKWYPIIKVNPQSVTVRGHWTTTIGNDEIAEYRAPSADDYEAAKAAAKIPPMCNYPGEGFRHMTAAEYAERKEARWSDFPKTVHHAATETHGAHRTGCARVPGDQWKTTSVYITDKPRKDPPKKEPNAPKAPAVTYDAPREFAPVPKAPAEQQPGFQFEQMRNQLEAGIQVVSAPQLFPTPPELAARMVEAAGLEPGHRVLEPSAGTGNILREIVKHEVSEFPGQEPCSVVAVEINSDLSGVLDASGLAAAVHRGDFLQCNGDLGMFDRILMNPPFANGADIEHIKHAMTMLKEGGRLVAICANGPRQREQLMPLADLWEDLPAGTFKEQGTGVNTALLIIEG